MEDPMSILPPELAFEIFSYLTPEELFVVRQVNKLWKNLVNCESLWRRFCEKKELMDFSPTLKYDTTPINGLCNYAKIYLNYEKTLRKNWLSGKNHILTELSSALTESITCWKKTFVRTSKMGSYFDLFQVDGQCKVHRLQRIDTRFKLEGSMRASLNQSWLAITTLNAVLLYYKDTNGEYKLKWILMFLKKGSTVLRYFYVNEETTLKQIDEFIKKYHLDEQEVLCKCLYPNYVWIYIIGKYIVIKLDEKSKEAVIAHEFLSFSIEICYDKVGVAVVQNGGLAIYNPDAQLRFTYNSQGKHDWMFRALTQSLTSVAFVLKGNPGNIILINRKDHNVLARNALDPLLLALHPNKPLLFAIMYSKSRGPFTSNDSSWTVRCYSCIDGQIIWNTNQMSRLPEMSSFLIIDSKYLLIIPLLPGACQYLFFDCKTGKFLSDTKDYYLPLYITDSFAICTKCQRSNKEILVKCYL